MRRVQVFKKMAEDFGKFQSSEDSREEGDPGTDTEQLHVEDRHENLTPVDGGHEHGTHVHTVYSTSNPESDDNKGKLLSPKSHHEFVGHVATSSHCTCKEIIDALQEKLQCSEAKIQQLELESGRRLFLEDKQKRIEKAYGLSSRTLASAKNKSCTADGAFCMDKAPGHEPTDSAFYMDKSPSHEPNNVFHMEGAPEHESNSAFHIEGAPEHEPTDGAFCVEDDPVHKPTDGAFCVEDEPVHKPTDGGFYMEEDRVQEPGLQPPTGQKLLDRVTELSIIPPRDHNLSARHDGGCDETSDGMHIQDNGGVSGINEADSVSNMSDGKSENSRSGMVVLPMNPVCNDLTMQSVLDVSDKEESVPASRHCHTTMHQSASDWTRFGARPKNRPPLKRTSLEPSLGEPVTSRLTDASPVNSSEIGICEAIIARHSQDRSLLESQHHCSTENVSPSNASLPGASYMDCMMNYIESTRIHPNTVDDQVASKPDEHNRSSLQLLIGDAERGHAVGGSTFSESLNGDTGPGCTQNNNHRPSTSMGNMAHAAAGNFDLLCSKSVGRSNGALNGVLSERESSETHSNLLNTAGDQVALGAVVSEPWRAESADSRDPMLDGNAVTDCNMINSALLALAQRIKDVFVASRERSIEREQQREARVRAWNSDGRLQGQASPPQGQASSIEVVGPCFLSPFGDFIVESLGLTHNSGRALVRREAAIRASTEEGNRWWCTCEPLSREVSSQDICRRCYRHRYLGPSSHSGQEHSCVCLENDGSQVCSVYGTIVAERCRPDSAHDTCCICLENVFSSCMILPCSHPLHRECLIGMIQSTSELNCPICGRAFLRRG